MSDKEQSEENVHISTGANEIELVNDHSGRPATIDTDDNNEPKDTSETKPVADYLYFDNSWSILWSGALVGIYLYTLLYLVFNIIPNYFKPFHLWTAPLPDLNKTDAHASFMIIHMINGILTMIFGLFQIHPKIRKSFQFKFHRIIGRICIFNTWICSLFGLIFMIINKFQTVGGPNMSTSFFLFGVYFFISGSLTFYYIRIKQNIELHKQWALRVYFLYIASMIYRIWFGVFGIFGHKFFDDKDSCNDDGTCPGALDGVSQFNAWWFWIGGEILLEFTIYSKYWAKGDKLRIKYRNWILNGLSVIVLILFLAGPIFAVAFLMFND